MATSLIDTVRQMITPTLLSQLSGAHGESIPAVEKGLGGASAALLGAIADRSDDPGFMSQLFTAITAPGISSAIESPERMLAQARGTAEPGSVLSRFQSLILGNRAGAIDTLARFAGLKTATASSLLGIASSLVLGQLTRIVGLDQLDARSLARRFATERSALQTAVPPGLVFPTAMSMPPVVERTVREDTLMAASDTPSRRRAWSPFAWVGAALLAAIAVWGLSSLLQLDRRPQVASIDIPRAVGTGGYVTRTLPGRPELRFRPMGTEERLLTHIQSPSIGRTEMWFEFDRLNFEKDSAVLMPTSREQLANTAAILKAYPNVRVKIGGYTDNSGAPVANIRLSQSRANAVVAELKKLGVDRNRLQAEGYGDDNAIASNATEEGRARNRRVAIRVISR